MKKLWVILTIMAMVALGAGLITGQLLDQSKTPRSGTNVPVELKELLLGTMVQNKRKGMIFSQKGIIAVGEPLAFKLTLDNVTEAGVSIGVRLLQGDGSLYQLAPDSVNVKEADATQCCWYIEKPGKYQFQLILPGKAPIVAPIQVKEATSSGSSNLSI